MAVNDNPYRVWQKIRKNSDYRSTDTQITSLVRQQLSQSEYLRSSNRVNPGPQRNTRAQIANNASQNPHVFASEDMWGWQKWITSKDEFKLINLGTNLIEAIDYIPGTSYLDSNVGGMSYASYFPSVSNSVQMDLNYPVITSDTTYKSYIGNIVVNTDNLTPSSQNYVMIYNPTNNAYEFTSPDTLLGLSDGDFDPTTVNFGTY